MRGRTAVRPCWMQSARTIPFPTSTVPTAALTKVPIPCSRGRNPRAWIGVSYTADPDNINSITIVELKRPQRDDADNDPVLQVLKYVRNIKDGKIKKKNGRDFGDVSRVAFYCYVIGDLTPSLKESAESRGLTQTQDKEGYFGYNPTYGAYVEVISYDKLLKDAKQRNKALFDKLFEPKAKDLVHPELLGRENKS